MSRRSCYVLWLSTVVCGLLVGHASTALSSYQRQHGSFCSVALGSPANFVHGANISTTGPIAVGCSMPDSHLYPMASAYVAVYVTAGHGTDNVLAYRCTEFSASEGATCGHSAISAGSGTQALNPPSTNNDFWQEAEGNEYPFVLVLLPRVGASTSIIKGITGVY